MFIGTLLGRYLDERKDIHSHHAVVRMKSNAMHVQRMQAESSGSTTISLGMVLRASKTHIEVLGEVGRTEVIPK